MKYCLCTALNIYLGNEIADIRVLGYYDEFIIYIINNQKKITVFISINKIAQE